MFHRHGDMYRLNRDTHILKCILPGTIFESTLCCVVHHGDPWRRRDRERQGGREGGGEGGREGGGGTTAYALTRT